MFFNYQVHELSEFMTVHEQPMFMNKVRIHEQNRFMNFHLLLKNIHEPFMNTLMNVDERS